MPALIACRRPPATAAVVAAAAGVQSLRLLLRHEATAAAPAEIRDLGARRVLRQFRRIIGRLCATADRRPCSGRSVPLVVEFLAASWGIRGAGGNPDRGRHHPERGVLGFG